MLNSSLYSSEKNSWETPDALFEGLNKEFRFELDVAANKDNAKCAKYYTEQDDGLNQDWQGTCWMNPPYGNNIKYWVKKAAFSNATVVCLLPVRTDTRWWHFYVMEKASEIRFLNRRLTFKGSTNKAPFPAAIVVFRPEKTKLEVKAISDNGKVSVS